MKLTDGAKRLNIFAYFDPDGVVDDYVVYLLREMRCYCTEQHLVVNGFLLPDEEEKLAPFCDVIIKRENEGYDITAYKVGFLSVKDIERFDEVLFFNQSIYGPLFSMENMFCDMAGRDVDFWGLTRHKGGMASTWDNKPFPPHLQSFFFAVRGEMLQDGRFKEYWQNLADIDGYWSAVDTHEVKFTQYFASLGYRWDSYIDTTKYESINDYHLMGMPELVLEMGCPFVKRKSFLTDNVDYLSSVQGSATNSIYKYIKNKTVYPFELIAQNLLRTCDIYSITTAIAPVFDSGGIKNTTKSKVAVVIWISSGKLNDFLLETIIKYSESYDVFCLSSDPETSISGVETTTISTDGLNYICGEMLDSLESYDFLLYLNDNIPLLLKEFEDATTLLSAVECLEPEGCVDILNKNPQFGLLVPPQNYHQEVFFGGTNWSDVKNTVEKRLIEQNMNFPLCERDISLAVRGNMFFADSKILEKLKGFVFDDELCDGLQPASEYILPIAAQSAGYMTGIATTASHAFLQMAYRGELLNRFSHMSSSKTLRTFHGAEHRMNSIINFYNERRFQMTLHQAYAGNLKFKDKLFIVAQLFIKPETFKKLRRGKEEPQPIDLLD